MSETTTGALAKALAAAQKAVRAVPHDARNDYHRYAYTSAEAILEATKDALADNGLALVPVSATLAVREGQVVLCSRSLLLHTSGESQAIEREFPVIPEKGRPLDKAVAGAMTTSLAYLIRDALCLPRCDPADDVAGREDRPQPQRQERPRPQQAAARQTAPAVPAATAAERLAAKGAELEARGLCAADELTRYVVGVVAKAGWSALPGEWKGEALQLAKKAIDAYEAERVDAKGALPRDAREARLVEYREAIDNATPEQLAEVEAEINAAVRDIGRDARDQLVRSVREKQELAKGKTRKAKAG